MRVQMGKPCFGPWHPLRQGRFETCPYVARPLVHPVHPHPSPLPSRERGDPSRAYPARCARSRLFRDTKGALLVESCCYGRLCGFGCCFNFEANIFVLEGFG